MNLLIEQSIRSWLIEEVSPFAPSAIRCGQSDEEVLHDQQTIVVSCEETRMQAPTLYVATVRLIISTPCLNETLESHRFLYSQVRARLKNAPTIPEYFPEDINCIDSAITSIAESQSDQKWLSSITIAFGIKEVE